MSTSPLLPTNNQNRKRPPIPPPSALTIRHQLRARLDAEAETHDSEAVQGEEGGYKLWLGEHLESQRTHRVVLTLIALDAIFVLTDLSYTFLSPPTCPSNPDQSTPTLEAESPKWLETLSYISLAITLLFLVEIPLDFWAFGPRWFGLSFKRKPVPHAFLHFFDAIVITGTAIFEIFLKGRERELAGLLILLRLWRLIKLVGGVAVGVGSWDEASVRLLEAAESRIAELEQQVEMMQADQRILIDGTSG